MQAKVSSLISNLLKIADDRSSGSLDMVFAILNAFEPVRGLMLDKKTIQEIQKKLAVLTIKQSGFISVFNVLSVIKNKLQNEDKLFSYLDNVRMYYNDLPERQVREFLQVGKIPEYVFVHSNSRSIKYFLLTLQINTKSIHRIYQTVSLPGGEGRLQAHFFEQENFTVKLIDDDEINSIIPFVDIAFFGADLILPDSFVNKVKTTAFCIAFKKANIPVYVLADSLKHVPYGMEEKLSEMNS
jgi:translation initiation factor 2B subunit (eIF-2B alpha/beta/delta family)